MQENNESSALCPVCGCKVNEEGSSTFDCERCSTRYHEDCWEYAGGCSRFGCDANKWKSCDVESPGELNKVMTAADNWSFTYGMQSISFLLISGALVGLFAAIPIVFMLSPFSKALGGPNLATLIFIKPMLTTFIAGLLGYFLFIVPNIITVKLLESKVGAALTHSSKLPLRVLKKTEGTVIGKFGFNVVRLMTLTVNLGFVLVVLRILLKFAGLEAFKYYGIVKLAVILLAVTRFIMIPIFNRIITSRLCHIDAVQTRLALALKSE